MKAGQQDIFKIAEDLGLDVGGVVVEEVPIETIYRIIAYGFPRNYPHWSRGREYWIAKRQYDRGMGKTYELVLNDDPPVVYVAEENTPLEKAFVIAHALGHVHVMRHNTWNLKYMRPGMIASARAARERVLEYERLYGVNVVENVIELGQSLDWSCDLTKPWQEVFAGENWEKRARDIGNKGLVSDDPVPSELLSTEDIDRQMHSDHRKLTDDFNAAFYGVGETDILLWLLTYPQLPDHVRDILSIIREQAIYHRGIVLTKILHEGFAAWTHTKILDQVGLSEEEIIAYSRLHAAIATPRPTGVNPYSVGVGVFRELEKRGVDVLEVAASENDASLFASYLDGQMIEDLGLYTWYADLEDEEWADIPVKHNREMDWRTVRDAFVRYVEWRNNPFRLKVVASNPTLRKTPYRIPGWFYPSKQQSMDVVGPLATQESISANAVTNEVSPVEIPGYLLDRYEVREGEFKRLEIFPKADVSLVLFAEYPTFIDISVSKNKYQGSLRQAELLQHLLGGTVILIYGHTLDDGCIFPVAVVKGEEKS